MQQPDINDTTLSSRSNNSHNHNWPELGDWVAIQGFPNYKVSRWGIVRRFDTDQEISVFIQNTGHPAVKLSHAGTQYTRGLAKLVAWAFVPKEEEMCDTVIHLDGDVGHCAAHNLAWKPRFWAYEWTRQFGDMDDTYMYPVLHEPTGEVFENLYQAAVTHTELVKWIHRCCLDNDPVSKWRTAMDVGR